MKTKRQVQARVTEIVLPTYLPAAPDKNPMFLEKRVYQGSSGKVYPLPFTDRIAEKPVNRAWQAIWIENEYLRVAVADNIFGPWTELGNPCQGRDADKTYFSQSTFVLLVAGQPGQLIAMFDLWKQWDLEGSRYVWLPLEFDRHGKPLVQWRDQWSLPVRK